MKIYKRKFPIIKINYSILIYDDPIELVDKFKDVRFQHDPRDFQGGFFEIDDHFFLAFLNDGKLTHGMVAHECKHLINKAFDFIGYNLDINNDEIECYFLTYLVDQVYNVLKLK